VVRAARVNRQMVGQSGAFGGLVHGFLLNQFFRSTNLTCFCRVSR
jgi:hypothetical protein